eukprot:TRINITY_DN11306_c0_g1_i1.p1 TRINITY_DN11306_c0_g1~~TRINITY_DN11306_c0_g1_i1.p1  ORF type:complete len:176 (-),score=42.13 TRINITY_DN11306_c0_g1_i1:82-609(-)
MPKVTLTLDYPDSGKTGEVTIDVHEEWAPHGAKRFLELVEDKYFDNCRIYRVIDGFMAQWGINGNLDKYSKWYAQKIPDDPVKQSNKRGRITFATSGPNARSCQIFINFVDNTNLDKQGFSPFGEVSAGMEHVDAIYKGYGEGGSGPSQSEIKTQGQVYLDKFPKLTLIKSAKLA